MKMKRMISIILSLCMLLSLGAGLDFSAYADDGDITISLELSEPIVIYENSNGSLQTRWVWDDEAKEGYEEVFYYYHMPSIPSGSILYMDYHDERGTVEYINRDGSFYERGTGNYLRGLSSTDSQYRNHWTLGDDNYFVLQYETGASTNVPVTIIENPIKSINYIPLNNIILYENTGGNTRLDEKQEEFYYYNKVDYFSSGNILEVTYKDERGTVQYALGYNDYYDNYGFTDVDDESNFISSNQVHVSDNQYSNHWTLGENHAYIDYAGISAPLPVYILKNPIDSISFTPLKPLEFVENTGGETHGQWLWNEEKGEFYDEYYYYYVGSYIVFHEGDILEISYNDERGTVQYVYDDDDRCFKDENGNVVDADKIGINTSQESNPWEVGKDNSFTIEYFGKEAFIDVSIVKNPVDSINYISAKPLEFIQNTNGYWDGRWAWDEENGEYYEEFFYYNIYSDMMFKNGDILEVGYNDGRGVVQYIYNVYSNDFEAENGDIIALSEIQDYTNQYSKPWMLGDDNSITIEYFGKEAFIDVSIIESPISRIEYKPYKPYTFIENTDGEYYDWLGYYYYNINKQVGDELIIYSKKSNTPKIYIYDYSFDTGEWAYFNPEDENDYISDDEVIINGKQYDEAWEVGDHQVYISYMGCEGTVVATVLENQIEGISFTPANPISIYENSCGNWSTPWYWDDETETDVRGDKYYHYNLNDLVQPGDILTISYKDERGSIDYTYYSGVGFVSFEANNVISEFNGSLSLDSDQHNNHWEIGKENTFTINYQGEKCEVPVEIVESPVLSVEFVPADGRQLAVYENTCGWWDTNSNDEEFFYYSGSVDKIGDKIIIHYNNGETKTYTNTAIDAWSGEYLDENGDLGNIIVDHSQWEHPWVKGGDYNYVTVYCDGGSIEVPVEILDNPFEKAQWISSPAVLYTYDIEDEDGITESGTMQFQEGNTVRIFYKDGTTKDFRYDKDRRIFVGDDNEELVFDGGFDYDGKNYIGNIFSFNLKIEIPVEKRPTNIKGVSFSTPIKSITPANYCPIPLEMTVEFTDGTTKTYSDIEEPEIGYFYHDGISYYGKYAIIDCYYLGFHERLKIDIAQVEPVDVAVTQIKPIDRKGMDYMALIEEGYLEFTTTYSDGTVLKNGIVGSNGNYATDGYISFPVSVYDFAKSYFETAELVDGSQLLFVFNESIPKLITLEADLNADASALEALIAKADSIDSSLFSEETYNAFMELINSISDELIASLSQEEIDKLVTEILTAINSLKPYATININATNGNAAIIYGTEQAVTNPSERVLIDEKAYPESDHNYDNNADASYDVSYPGASSLSFTFDGNCKSEKDYDIVYIYDKDGNEVGKYSGDFAGEAFTVKGDFARIRFVSDRSQNYYGFGFDSIYANFGPSSVLMDKLSYPESNHNYDNNADISYPISYPGASSLTFTFDKYCKSELDYDIVYIYDKDNKEVGKYSGYDFAGKTFTVMGDSATVKFVSDRSQNYYGFGFSSIWANFGINTVLMDKAKYPESPHNYGDSQEYTYSVSHPGALSLTTTFSSSCKTEENYDLVYIYSKDGELLYTFSGDKFAGETFTVNDDGYTIKFVSDRSQNFYGFSIDSIYATMPEEIANTSGSVTMLYGTEVTITATPNSGYIFDGWYEKNSKRIVSTSPDLTFKASASMDFEARFVLDTEATITFMNDSGWIAGSTTLTRSQWKEMKSLREIVPELPYKLGATSGRWDYNEQEALAALVKGESVTVYAVFEGGITLPTAPEASSVPTLSLSYLYDNEKSVGSFVMTPAIPESCEINSIGIAIKYSNASIFEPSDIILTLDEKSFTSQFQYDSSYEHYITDILNMSSRYNWAAVGYVTYIDENGELATAYSNQVNIKNCQWVQ